MAPPPSLVKGFAHTETNDAEFDGGVSCASFVMVVMAMTVNCGVVAMVLLMMIMQCTLPRRRGPFTGPLENGFSRRRSRKQVFQMPCDPTPVGSVGACDVICDDAVVL